MQLRGALKEFLECKECTLPCRSLSFTIGCYDCENNMCDECIRLWVEIPIKIRKKMINYTYKTDSMPDIIRFKIRRIGTLK